MTDAIHIDDLAAPQLTDAQRGALAWGESLDTALDPETVLEAARVRTGLDDFGPPDFRERLALLCDEWGNDAGVTAFHRFVLQGYLVRYASNMAAALAASGHPVVDEKVATRHD